MGLDNGIDIVRNDYSDKIKALSRFTVSYDKDKSYPFEVCYWRNCWNVRQDIFDLLMHAEDGDIYQIRLNLEDIKAIRKLLKKYNAKNWFWNWMGSMWTWSEHKKFNRRHIRNLKRLIKVMKKYPDLEVYFYDSY